MSTPAPQILDSLTKNAVSELIKADPRSEKLQDVISQYKDKYADDFKNINPIPLDELSPAEQEKRNKFIRSAKDCTKIASDSATTGKIIIPPNPCRDTSFDKMEAQMTNFFNKIQGPGSTGLDMTSEIRDSAQIMSRSMNTFVNKVTGSLNDKLSKSIGDGMAAFKSMEFSKVNPSYPMPAALKVVIANQLSLAPKVMGILDKVFCVGSKIQDAMVDSMTDLLTAAVKNTTNVPACAVQEMIGAINNTIMNDMDDAITPLLGPLTNVLGPVGFEFDIKGVLGGGIDILKKADAFSSCEDRPSCPSSSKYIIGKGSRKGANAASTASNFAKMASSSSLVNKATNAANAFEKKYGSWNLFGSPLAESVSANPCYTGNPTNCGGPTIEIFGGGGSGGAGQAILGNFIDKLDTEDIFAAVKRTASIAGVEITDRGSGYTSDPMMVFDDECNQGYGAYGKAHVDKNPKSPTYGQIISITIISPGTNYPAQDEEVPLFIEKIVIVNPGTGYKDTDTLDDFEICGVDSNGGITCIDQINQIAYSSLPELNINSETGVGAILRPVMSKTRPQGEVIQVIDCVGR